MKTIVDKEKLVDKPVVSVFCITYNQADYIGKCIDGFLAQETDFPFEILINDDASADGTTDIVASYAEAHPDKIVAVFHEENQYSKGVNNIIEFLWPLSRGQYIAFCEGDDWWTDPCKLQRQFNAMEAHPEATWCVHASENVDAVSGRVLSVMREYDRDCTLEFAQTGRSISLAATASFFVRRDVFADYVGSLLCGCKCHGDFKMSRFFSFAGPTIYLEKSMSAYRVLAKGSINSGIAQSDEWREIITRLVEERIRYLHALDDLSDRRLSADIAEQIERIQYLGALQLKDYRSIHEKWPDEYATEPFLSKFKVELFGRCPKLHDFHRRLKMKRRFNLRLGN